MDINAYNKGFEDEAVKQGVHPLQVVQAMEKLAAAADAPNYRLAESTQKCGNCAHYEDGKCTMYDFPAAATYTCSAWAPEQA